MELRRSRQIEGAGGQWGADRGAGAGSQLWVFRGEVDWGLLLLGPRPLSFPP